MRISAAVERQKGVEASSLEHRMMFIWLNKITFEISVSAYYLYPALKKAAKWSKVLLGKEPGTIPQSSSISPALWEKWAAQITLLKKWTVLWEKQSCAFTNPLSRLHWNTPGLASDESWQKQKLKKVEMAAEGPWEKRRWEMEKETNTFWLLESCLVTCLLSHCWKRREEQFSTEQPLWKEDNRGN